MPASWFVPQPECSETGLQCRASAHEGQMSLSVGSFYVPWPWNAQLLSLVRGRVPRPGPGPGLGPP